MEIEKLKAENLELKMKLDTLIVNVNNLKLTDKKEINDKIIEIIKYHLGLKSKYQPPTGYKFYHDDNEGLINTIIN